MSHPALLPVASTADTPAMADTLTPLINQYLTSRQRQHRYNPKSLRVVRPRLATLADHFGNRPLPRLTRRAVENWLESLDRLAQNSRCAYLASVRQFTRWLAAEGHLHSDPCATIPPLPRARSVPRAQTSAAVAAVLRCCRDDRDRAIVWLEVGCGLRRAEVTALRWEHYDERGRTLLVRGKGGHERFLPVPDDVAAALAAVRTATTGPIIASHTTGAAITPETAGRITTRLMRDAGAKQAAYDGVSGHALRHTAASDVLDRCGDLRVVQQMLGHEHLSSTSIYLRRAKLGALRDAMEGREYDAA